MAATPAAAPAAIEAETIRKLRIRIISFVFHSLRYLLHRSHQHWVCGIDDEQRAGYHEPAVRIHRRNLLFRLFHFRDTQQPAAAEDRSACLDCPDFDQLGNRGNADWLREDSRAFVYFTISARGG